MGFYSASPILFESISAVTATPSVDVGTVRTHDGEKYVYVYNAGGAATGTGVGLSRPASCAAGMYSCSASSISGDLCIGFVKHATIGAAQYGWALTRGRVNVAVASAASDQSAGPKALGANGLVATIAAGYYPVGELNTAIVSGNSGYLYVNLPS
jgi:hypothetical protein